MIVQNACDNDANRLKTIAGRFVSVVFPGETLRLRGWYSESQSVVIFEMMVLERRKVVLTGKAVIDVPSKL